MLTYDVRVPLLLVYLERRYLAATLLDGAVSSKVSNILEVFSLRG